MLIHKERIPQCVLNVLAIHIAFDYADLLDERAFECEHFLYEGVKYLILASFPATPSSLLSRQKTLFLRILSCYMTFIQKQKNEIPLSWLNGLRFNDLALPYLAVSFPLESLKLYSILTV